MRPRPPRTSRWFGRDLGWLGLALGLTLGGPAAAQGPSPLHTLVGHAERVEALAFSGDGATLATAGPDRIVRLWNVADGQRREFVTPNGPVPAEVDVGVAVAEVVFAPSLPADPLRLGPRRTPAPKKLAVIGADRSFTLWDADKGRLLARLDEAAKPVHGVGFDDQGRMLVTAAWDHQDGQRMWEVSSGIDRAASSAYVPLIRSVAFPPNGRMMASGDFDGRMRYRDLSRKFTTHEFLAHDDAVWCATFSPNGTLMVTGGGDGRVRFWDARDGLPKGGVDAHAGGVRALGFSPSGKVLATGGVDHVAKLWEVAAIIDQ